MKFSAERAELLDAVTRLQKIVSSKTAMKLQKTWQSSAPSPRSWIPMSAKSATKSGSALQNAAAAGKNKKGMPIWKPDLTSHGTQFVIL